jgi:hypothetical protein
MPHFKSISFAGAPHPVALKFADGDSLFERVNEMTSAGVREAIGCDTSIQPSEKQRSAYWTITRPISVRKRAASIRLQVSSSACLPSPVRFVASTDFFSANGNSAAICEKTVTLTCNKRLGGAQGRN